MSLLDVKNLRKSYNRREVVKGIMAAETSLTESQAISRAVNIRKDLYAASVEAETE